jgi:chromate reductase
MQGARKIDIGRPICKNHTVQFRSDQSWPSTDEGELVSISSGVKLLGLSGSIGKAAANTIILRSLAERLDAMTVFPLNNVPIYNGDLDGGHLPDAVRALRMAITEADGLILCTPDYNRGMPGMLKNALDWASRPHTQMQQTLASTLSRVVLRPQVVICWRKSASWRVLRAEATGKRRHLLLNWACARPPDGFVWREPHWLLCCHPQQVWRVTCNIPISARLG